MTDGETGRGLTAGGHYFTEPDQIGDESLRLPPDEARHALRVVRLGVGDEIAVVDGGGGWYRARIESVDREGLVASILERRVDVGEPDYAFTVGLGLLKHHGRFETFLEKAVELGVTRIMPLVTERSQSSQIHMKRCRRILVAGLKQSLRSRLPDLMEPCTFEMALRQDAEVRMIAHEGAENEESLINHLDAIRTAASCSVLIGPEGGFSDGELEKAARAGWTRVSLGASRLRAETAGMAAAAMVQLIKSAGGSD